jgi:hypothetical protein
VPKGKIDAIAAKHVSFHVQSLSDLMGMSIDK